MSNRRRNQSMNMNMNMLIYLMVLLKERAFGLISLIIAIALFTYPLYKGNFDRFISDFNQDKVTAKDLIYQTGNVRVYKFQDRETTCYVADKQGLSASIFCN